MYNHGSLPPGVTIEKIKHGFSKPRNHRIAEVLHKCGYIETWGRGIQNIIELCKKANVPEPEFFADNLEFKVTFKFPHNIAPEVIAIDKNIKLTARQKEILAILSNAGSLSLKDITKKLSHVPAERTLRHEMSKLSALGLVSSKGTTKDKVWFIKDSAIIRQ